MDINKAIVTAALKQLGDSFTVGQLVDKILEEVKDAARRIFYHHKIMTNDGLMRLSVVDVTDTVILDYDNHINAIENHIRHMVRELVINGDGDIDEGELENLHNTIEEYLNENVAHYDGDEVEEAVQAIINSDMFKSLKSELHQTWHETNIPEISLFYNSFMFKKDYKEQLALAKETYDEMGTYSYIEILSSILGWEDENDDEDE